MNRREFLQRAALATVAGSAVSGCKRLAAIPQAPPGQPLFKISLAEWSLHRMLGAKEMDHLDFPKIAKKDYGIDAVELVNQFFKDKAKDKTYLTEFRNRAHDLGVRILLIMIDDMGHLGDPDPAKRERAVENHYPWVEAAEFLGCHSLRVNAETGNVGTFEEQQNRAADGLRKLALLARDHHLNVIVENHGHLSSNGKWLSGVMRQVNLPNLGTLPDFGNFYDYDRYQGVAEMMPFAKAVSAKTHDFNKRGEDTLVDYHRMMRIVLSAGYHGYLGIEYEGENISEPEGIRLSKTLLERIRGEFQNIG